MRPYSLGILLFRVRDAALEVLLVHPGGPLWEGKDRGAWSIPKGLAEAGEEPLTTARREFAEETGFAVDGEFIDLGEVKQPSGKIVRAWALRGDVDAAAAVSNHFSMEWPPHSGQRQEFPEVDAAAWCDLATAAIKISPGQAPFLRRLQRRLAAA